MNRKNELKFILVKIIPALTIGPFNFGVLNRDFKLMLKSIRLLELNYVIYSISILRSFQSQPIIESGAPHN